VPQARDTPDSHNGVENHRRPQGDADRLRPYTGSSEDDHRAQVIQHHRADQSSRSAALLVITRKPAGDAQCEQRNPVTRPRGMIAPVISASSSNRTTMAGTAINPSPVDASIIAVSLSKRFMAFGRERQAVISDRLPCE